MSGKAKDSYQILKARKKLEKKIAQEDKLINEKTLGQMKKVIQFWIKRHKTDRVKVAKKSIELFDENRHSAKIKSKFVSHLLDRLKKEAAKTKTIKPLIGRIKNPT